MEIFQYNFMINAILASIFASIAMGIIGTYILIKRIVFISGGISHTAYGGIGLGIFLSINPFYGALIFSVLTALFLAFLRRIKTQNEDLLIGILWAFGMAVGILFSSFKTGYTPNLMSFLFGNILSIPIQEIYFIVLLDIALIIFVSIFYKELQAITFDEEYAKTRGIAVNFMYTILFVFIALTTVILIRIVGVMLVVAMISIPSAISIKYAKSLKQLFFLSMTIGAIINILGIFISFYFDLPTGAIIILIGVFFYVINNLTTFRLNQ